MITSNSIESIDNHGFPVIRQGVINLVNKHFTNPTKLSVGNLYNLMLEQFEGELLKVLMKRFRNNQSKISRLLGLSRGTTRRMLKKYGFIY